MVCPVTTKGVQTRTVYLPAGEWYDWWTGKKYKGNSYVHVVTPLDIMPIFAKAGAIIPIQPAMNFVDEKKIDTLTLEVFPGTGSFELYEDDGKSLAYKNGDYSLTGINVQTKGNITSIKISQSEGKFIPSNHNYLVKLRSAEKPKQVLVNGATGKWSYEWCLLHQRRLASKHCVCLRH